ncbi:MAG: tRNA (adenosine(37)-N6)-threonylcarbamoyltransferase complex dimerization subunit type 1 TsaB [Treponema sp.]|jgi:tRNA threonylcarbamoyladenosine biosynthesis protein TsaB|nr:tRNA (adenosine(37)-N6)-threonylcarbamoyltransferase complex dimerization subunit type 1 TsaB [Treponema sp.]
MNILAIDSACSTLSVAVAKGEDIYYTETTAEMKQSEIVMELINSQMEKAGLKPDELNGVLCMGGPGSFTGLRIGYSIAKGLALALSINFAPVPTPECIANSITQGVALALIEARKNAYFYAFFRDGNRITDCKDADSAQIAGEIKAYNEKIILTGPGSELFYHSLPDENKKSLIPNFENRGYAKDIITIAKKLKILDNNNTEYLYSGPEYIRKTDAELNLAKNTGS